MSRTQFAMLVAAVFAVAATTSIAADEPPAKVAASTSSFEFTSKQMSFTDAKPRGESVGDSSVHNYSAREIGGEARVGIAINQCVLGKTGKRPIGLCTGALQLADGTISLHGTSGSDKVTRFAVIGGTGRYLGAAGVLSSKPKGRTLSVSLELK